MNTIFPKLSKKILAFLFTNENESFYVREIGGRVNASAMGASKALTKLESDGIVKSSRRGKMKFFSVNKEHPSYSQLKEILERTTEFQDQKSLKASGKQKEIAEEVRRAMSSDPNRENIKGIFLFGSYLRGHEKPGSDIDLYFEMRRRMSLFKILETQRNLEEKLGRKVDFIEKDSLDKYLKDKIIREAKKVYEYR